MEADISLIEEARIHAESLLVKLPRELVYHNLNHSKEVVKAAVKIGRHSNLSEEEMEIVQVAALFHDTGFVRSLKNHEEESKKLSAEFLESKNYPREKIDLVLGCIEVTKPDSSPKNNLEKVISDADFSHMAKGSYFDKMLMLRKEDEHIHNQSINDLDWHLENLRFLKEHQFHTEYGKTVLEPKRLSNVRKQEKIIKKLRKLEDEAIEQELNIDKSHLKALKKKLKKVEGRPDRGIETMFRLTSRNHIRLSAMADSKANILISVNAIIISVLIGGLIKTLDNHPHLIVPTYLLLSINVITIIFSILSTRPNVTKGKFTLKDIEDKKTNLLFFGNFHRMTQQDYKWGMLEMMNDSDYLYSSLIDDIYFLGKVLGKKYYFLRIAYNIFMIGIILAVISYVISNWYYLSGINT